VSRVGHCSFSQLLLRVAKVFTLSAPNSFEVFRHLRYGEQARPRGTRRHNDHGRLSASTSREVSHPPPDHLDRLGKVSQSLSIPGQARSPRLRRTLTVSVCSRSELCPEYQKLGPHYWSAYLALCAQKNAPSAKTCPRQDGIHGKERLRCRRTI
jgi:hypothetical protein